jgi:Flp pilus assembly pilin Flp
MGFPRRVGRIAAEGGATSVEYAILASLIAAVIVIAVVGLGLQLPPIFQSAADGFP